jgi:hypothetical protein
MYTRQSCFFVPDTMETININLYNLIKKRKILLSLQDFIDLLPLDDIKAIADEHLQTDGAFAAVVLYLKDLNGQNSSTPSVPNPKSRSSSNI